MDRQAKIAQAALVGAALLLATACAGHNSKAAKPTAHAGTGTTAAKADSSGRNDSLTLTHKQLESAAITSSDAPGWEVSVPKSASGPIGGQKMVADKAVCQPVADALSETGAVKAVAVVDRTAVAKDSSGVMTRIRLASYSGGDANKVMAGLGGAASDCKGFTGTGGGGKQHVGVAKYDGYLMAQSTVTLRLTTKVGQQVLPVYLDVGLVGSTVEYFLTFNVTGDDPGTGSTTAQVQQLVKLSQTH